MTDVILALSGMPKYQRYFMSLVVLVKCSTLQWCRKVRNLAQNETSGENDASCFSVFLDPPKLGYNAWSQHNEIQQKYAVCSAYYSVCVCLCVCARLVLYKGQEILIEAYHSRMISVKEAQNNGRRFIMNVSRGEEQFFYIRTCGETCAASRIHLKPASTIWSKNGYNSDVTMLNIVRSECSLLGREIIGSVNLNRFFTIMRPLFQMWIKLESTIHSDDTIFRRGSVTLCVLRYNHCNRNKVCRLSNIGTLGPSKGNIKWHNVSIRD